MGRKGPKKVCYGVRGGREGSRVYKTWSEVEANYSGVSNASQKGFMSWQEAQAWVDQEPLTSERVIENRKRPWEAEKYAGVGGASTVKRTRPDGYVNGGEGDRHAAQSPTPARNDDMISPLPAIYPSSGTSSNGFSTLTPPNHVSLSEDQLRVKSETGSRDTSTHYPQGVGFGGFDGAGMGGLESGLYRSFSEPSQPSQESRTNGHGTQEDPYELDSDVEDLSTKTSSGPSAFLVKDASFASTLEHVKDTDIARQADPQLPQDEPEPELCKEQKDLLYVILTGNNVFYTGSAGCGKSTVLRAFVKILRQQRKTVDIVAPTGRAALAVKGTTTYVYAGWTVSDNKRHLNELLAKVHGKSVWQRLKDTDVLVIEEISMVESSHFDRLNELMKEARGNSQPFGGVQLIVTGDFCQLPPVAPFQFCWRCGKELKRFRDERQLDPFKDKWAQPNQYVCDEHGEFLDENKWTFRSKSWKECKFENFHLNSIHRQSSDPKFIGILQKVRVGKGLSQYEVNLLRNHRSETTNSVKLFCTNKKAAAVNAQEFHKLGHPIKAYRSVDYFGESRLHPHLAHLGERDEGFLKHLDGHRYTADLQLKKGMLVILLANLSIDRGLVNGSTGRIIGFQPFEEVPTIPIEGGEFNKLREARLKNFEVNARECGVREWPVVQFSNGEEATIVADCEITTYGDESPYVILSRTQIPLMAGWAITIHRSQGMTLERAEVDLTQTFAPGQIYVALSRAKTLTGLKVTNLPDRKIKTGDIDKQVQNFLLETFNIGAE